MRHICFLLKNFTKKRSEEKFTNGATFIFIAFMKMSAVMLFAGKSLAMFFEVVKSFKRENRKKTSNEKHCYRCLIFSDLL